MTIEKRVDGEKLVVTLTGKLDTTTAPELAEAMEDAFSEITELVFDVTELDYVSSAGLRELFRFQKKMTGLRGTMKIVGTNEDVREIFDITGFTDLFTIE